MAEDTLRTVTIDRIGFARYRARNVRGGIVEFGEGGAGEDFSALELLLVALAGCSAADVDYMTSRRAEPDAFSVEARAHKVKDEDGNHLERVEVIFRVEFPDGKDGDAARTRLPTAVRQSHDRLCTVSRTVELPTAVAAWVEDPALDG